MSLHLHSALPLCKDILAVAINFSPDPNNWFVCRKVCVCPMNHDEVVSFLVTSSKHSRVKSSIQLYYACFLFQKRLALLLFWETKHAFAFITLTHSVCKGVFGPTTTLDLSVAQYILTGSWASWQLGAKGLDETQICSVQEPGLFSRSVTRQVNKWDTELVQKKILYGAGILQALQRGASIQTGTASAAWPFSRHQPGNKDIKENVKHLPPHCMRMRKAGWAERGTLVLLLLEILTASCFVISGTLPVHWLGCCVPPSSSLQLLLFAKEGSMGARGMQKAARKGNAGAAGAGALAFPSSTATLQNIPE